MERREVLEAAFDKLEEGEDPTQTVVEDDDASKQEAAKGDEGKGQQEPIAKEDQSLEEAKGGEKEKKAPSADGLGAAKKADPTAKKSDEALERAAQAAGGDKDNSKPPVSWKAGAKEQWAKLPLDVKQDVIRREQEINRYITQNDHHRKFNEAFTNTIRPFEHLIRAQNSTPLLAVRNLMTTAAALATGDNQQKAAVIADIIKNYNVDVEVLDKVLSGRVDDLKNNRGNGTIDPAILQALQPVYGFMNEINQAREQRTLRQQQEAEELVAQHESLPFFDDLRDDIADILEISAKRGVQMTIPQAYEKAVSLNPEIKKIMDTRKAAEEARANGGTRLAKARRAASTISGAPAGGGGASDKPKTRKEALEAAWDEAAQ